MRKSKVNEKLEELKLLKEQYSRVKEENIKLVNQLYDANKEISRLKDTVVTKDEILTLLGNRITWYEGRIKECKGLYTDVYVENLLIGKYETEQIFEFIMEHTFDKKE
ncbi:MAG: hypothetical protein J6A15_01355 [Clostridia bacterium]|nr:hypothetical protein [Clostridia bacterium]